LRVNLSGVERICVGAAAIACSGKFRAGRAWLQCRTTARRTAAARFSIARSASGLKPAALLIIFVAVRCVLSADKNQNNTARFT
jgi:hypothetical protein